MLQQSGKTARELGLLQAYVDALWEVLRRLEAGGVKYGARGRLRGDRFNMSVAPLERGEAGCIGCISAWAGALFHEKKLHSDAYYRLTPPPQWRGSRWHPDRNPRHWDAFYRLITPRQWRRRSKQ